jgi:Flp pilus assembly pilin Flp
MSQRGPRRLARWGGERGAGSIEYAGIILLVSTLLAASIAAPAADVIGGRVAYAICKAFEKIGAGGGNCVDPQDRARDLAIPCVLNQTNRTLGYNVNVNFVRGDRKDTDQVQTKADGSGSVTMSQGSGIGVEASKKQPKLPEGESRAIDFSGTARAGVMGDLGYIYNFPNEYGGADAAKSFLDTRRGGVGQAVQIVVPGAQTLDEGATRAANTIEDGWNWVKTQVGQGPSPKEQAAIDARHNAGTADAVTASVSLQGVVGGSADAGIAKGSVELNGSVKGQTTVALNTTGPDKGTSSFTGEAKYDLSGNLTLGIPGDPIKGIGDIPPFLNVGGGYGNSAQYTVTFDKDGNPDKLVFTTETRKSGNGGLKPSIPIKGTKLNPTAGVKVGEVTRETRTLDLNDPTNLALFNKVFDTAGVSLDGHTGKIVSPSVYTQAMVPEFLANSIALWQRTDADAYIANYTYDMYGDNIGTTLDKEKGFKGGWGVGGEKTSTTLTLTGATGQDKRFNTPEVALATCEG